MKHLILLAVLLATPVAAQEASTLPVRDGPLDTFAALVILPAGIMYALGQAWQGACEGAGYTFAVDPADNLWKCTAE